MKINNKIVIIVSLCLAVVSCKTPSIVTAPANKAIPESYTNSKDTTNMSNIPYKKFFKDKNLVDLIDIAINNNQELMITLQEIQIAKNDIRFRKGALLPTIGLRAGTGIEKVGRYTSQGAGDASTEITPGIPVPDALSDITIGAYANWEVDVWKKLRNSKRK